jgi:Fe-S oxidoreductase
MAFLNAKDPKTIAWLRLSMINFGFRMQRWASSLWRLWQQKNASLSKVIRSTEKSAPPIQQIVHFIRKPLPKNIPRQTARAMLDIQDDRVIPIIRSADKAGSEAVFYFPGCGSERLFSQVGLATQAMLWHIGVQTVLPPGYLCCGYPQTASGQKQKGDWITAENRVLFHRMANTLNYLDIKTVLVSCGTCLDQLARYNFEQIFPGCRVIDIHEFLMEKGISSSGISGVQYVYHDPCHSPMKQHQPSVVVNRLIGTDVPLSDRCCGESGTFSVARPDIASQVRSKKEEVLMRDRSNIPNPQQGIKVLTSCPSCLQGLARYESITGEEADYIVVELAKNILGHDWLNDFIHQARQGGIERVLL